VFEAFAGDSKMDALLHGHSYSGHACGASAGVSALSIFSNPALNPALAPGGGRLKELWPTRLVDQLSHTHGVENVVALGKPETCACSIFHIARHDILILKESV
jgi:dethiobiotin synthetase/adenosylmethionine--8-amino-7-oxononanoate aminotransferase